jgi:hypothetical protein
MGTRDLKKIGASLGVQQFHRAQAAKVLQRDAPAKTGTFCNWVARLVASTCSTFEVCCISFIRVIGIPRHN